MRSKTIEGLRISESYINATDNSRIGDSGVYEPFTNNVGKLFRSLQREYGRCESTMYVDTPTGAQGIGWVFSKMVKYEDCQERYIREVWVALHTAAPETKTTYHYASI